MYSLMGVGTYGGPGLNPMVSAHLWKNLYSLKGSLRFRGAEMSQIGYPSYVTAPEVHCEEETVSPYQYCNSHPVLSSGY